MLRWLLCQHLPGKNIRTVETTQSQATVGRIEAVMPLTPIGMKHESGCACLIIQLDLHANFEWHLRRGGLGKQERPATESSAQSIDQNTTGPLLPMRAK